MASFTDRVPEFNPYIAQLPVDAMVKVGMEKQRKYEEGVTKIQSYIDSIAGMDVMRDVDKGYLQNKLNELGNNLRVVAGADFSNFQLVNSVSGMATQITKDKFVQAAVQSTAHHRKEAQRMEDDRKNGKLTPDNEDYYNKKLYNYLNDNNLGYEDGNPINFSASYIPHFDVWKFAKETFDAVKPDELSFDQVFVTDGSGKPIRDRNGNPVYSPVLVRMEKEGIFPAKVKETLDQIFSDPRVSQQLTITGEYNYKNYTPEALMAKVNQQRDASLATVNNMLLELNMKKNSGQDVQGQIDDLKKRRDVMLNNFYEYGKLVNSNPDAVRGQLYKDDVNERYTTMFGWTKTKETQHDNPGWKANFEMQKEANEQNRFAQTLNFQMRKHADDMYIELLKLEAGKKGGRKGSGGIGGDGEGPVFTEDNQPSDIDVIGAVQQDYDRVKNDFMASSDEFLWQSIYAGDATNESELKRLMAGGMGKSQAKSAIINDNARMSGVSPEEYRATWGEKAITRYEKLTPQQKKARNLDTEAYVKFRNSRNQFVDASSLYKSYMLDDLDLDVSGATITIGGSKIQLTPGDIMDLAVYHQGNRSVFGIGETDTEQSRSKLAYNRLKAKGLGEFADEINRAVSAASSPLTPTGMIRGFRDALPDLLEGGLYGMLGDVGQKKTVAWKVRGVVDKISDENYVERLETRANLIKSKYGVRSNLQAPALSGNTEADKNTIFKFRSLASSYGEVGNESYDFKDFVENLPAIDKLDEKALRFRTYMGADGESKIEAVVYDNNNERKGGMTMSAEEAYQNFGIDMNTLYEPREVSMIKNIIMSNGGTSSKLDPTKVETYINGDYIMDNGDFPGMQGSNNYDVRVNFTYFNGKYFPHVFVNDGSSEPRVKDLPGIPNLQDALVSLQTYMTPQFAQTLLTTAPKQGN